MTNVGSYLNLKNEVQTRAIKKFGITFFDLEKSKSPKAIVSKAFNSVQNVLTNELLSRNIEQHLTSAQKVSNKMTTEIFLNMSNIFKGLTNYL